MSDVDATELGIALYGAVMAFACTVLAGLSIGSGQPLVAAGALIFGWSVAACCVVASIRLRSHRVRHLT